jgi:hypothetical protein
MIRWDPYAVRPPVGDWEYVVDDRPLRRAAKGSPRLLDPRNPFVRLCPSTWHCVWRNEYLTVFEGLGSPHTLIVRGAIYLRARDEGADLLDFEALIIDPRRERDIIYLVPEAFRARASTKLTRVMEWYDREVNRRETGLPAALTSYEHWYDTEIRRLAS